jgi:hypothetical protein
MQRAARRTPRRPPTGCARGHKGSPQRCDRQAQTHSTCRCALATPAAHTHTHTHTHAHAHAHAHAHTHVSRHPQRRKDKALPTDRLEQAWGEWPPLQRALEEPAPPKDGAAAAAPPLGPEAGRWWAALGGAARALGWGAAAADGAVAAS